MTVWYAHEGIWDEQRSSDRCRHCGGVVDPATECHVRLRARVCVLEPLLHEAHRELSCIEAALALPGGRAEMDMLFDLVQRMHAAVKEK